MMTCATVFAGQWVQNAQLNSVEVERDGAIKVVILNNPISSCNPNILMYKVGAQTEGAAPVTAEGLKYGYSTLLTAMSTGQPIDIYVDTPNGTNQCNIGNVVLKR
jgi:hypothetical protein